jgi:hypothetical protein
MKKLLIAYDADFYYASHVGLLVIPEPLYLLLLGEHLYLGEVGGKHSEAEITLDDKNFKILSEDKAVIAALPVKNEWGTVFGRNPLERLYERKLDEFDLDEDSLGRLDALDDDLERLLVLVAQGEA